MVQKGLEQRGGRWCDQTFARAKINRNILECERLQ